MEQLDLIIVGAGPAGLSAAARAQARGVSYVLLERSDHPADTVFCYQKGKPVMAEPSLIPLRSDVGFAAGRREEILGAWSDAVSSLGLAIRYRQEVKAITPAGDGGAPGFRVKTVAGEFTAPKLVLAMGTQGNPRKLGTPGEDLPHVSHRLIDPAEHQDEDVVVVGAGDAALEVAIALTAANRVHLVVRRPEIVRAKEALEREILALGRSGELTIHYSTVVQEIRPDEADLAGPEGVVTVPADRVFLMLGADPPRKFLESLGVAFTGSGRAARPKLGPDYQAEGVPGLYLVGSVAGRGDLIKLGMNQGWEVVEHLLGNDPEPADEAVLVRRLPLGEGPVRQRIERLRGSIPVLGAASQADLREVFLTAEVKSFGDGDVILRQNDYTNTFLVIARGEVAISAKPQVTERGDKPKERHVATLSAGGFFGEMGLISGQRRNATARAVGDTRLIEIPRKAMLKLLATAPDVARIVDQAFLLRAFQTHLFPGVPVEVLRELVAQASVEARPAGEVVFSEGDPGDAFYLIRSGMVKVSQGAGEQARVLSYLQAGAFFGEAALLPGVQRTATVATIFPTELIRLDRERFQEFLAERPDLAPRFVDTLEERRVATLISAATPGAGEIQSRLIDEEIVMGTDVLVIDDHKCIRCGNCIAACEGVHEDGQARLTLTGIHFYNLLFPNSCWQCEDPLCMLDCPPDALVRDATGEIHIKSNCIGCGNCETNCPYGNIFMVHPKEGGPFSFLRKLVGLSPKEAERQVAVKCDMTSRPGGPACVLSCPTGAAMRLDRDEYEDALAELVVLKGDG